MAVHLFILLPDVRTDDKAGRECGCLYHNLEGINEVFNNQIAELELFEKYVIAERDLKTYYDSDIVTALSDIVSNFRGDFPQVETDLLMDLLAHTSNLKAINWKDERVSEDSIRVYANRVVLKNDILSEAVCRAKRDITPKPLLINMSAISAKHLHCQIAGETHSEAIKLPLTPMYAVEVTVKLKESRHPQREYCHNDKHNLPDGYISSLESTREMAAHMLQVAVGEEKNQLWAYDVDTNTYAAYRSEDKNDEGKKWHAYTPRPEIDRRRKNLSTRFLHFLQAVSAKHGKPINS